jgi:hypothetical protein
MTPKKPTNLAIYLSGKTEYFRIAFFEGLERLKLDGVAYHQLPTVEEIEKEIKSIEKVKK